MGIGPAQHAPDPLSMQALDAPLASTIVYRIDAADVLTEVGGAWDEFARANGDLGTVVGRPLWHFVSGEDVCAAWALLLRRARAAGRPITFTYRCDAPGLRRLMEMELESGDGGAVTFRSRQLRTTVAPTYNGRWEPPGSHDPVVVCGWCAHVLRGSRWRAAEEATDALGFAGGQPVQLTHGICDTCEQELRTACA